MADTLVQQIVSHIGKTRKELKSLSETESREEFQKTCAIHLKWVSGIESVVDPAIPAHGELIAELRLFKLELLRYLGYQL